MIVNQKFREDLELCMSVNLPINLTAAKLKASRQTIYNELRYGLTEEEIRKKEWEKYNAKVAQRNYEKQLIEKRR